MRKIRKGDEVIIVTGKDKGRTGKVIRVTTDERVFVEGVNMIKKHAKPNPARGVAGGIIEREASIHVSNVALFNPADRKSVV